MEIRERLSALAARLQSRPDDVRAACTRALSAGFVPGALVVLADGSIGEVRGLNLATFGFFTGERYPLLVERDELVSEYGLEDGLRLVRIADDVCVQGYRDQTRGTVVRVGAGELAVERDGQASVFRVSDIARVYFS